ncbi:hypothetical protein A2U01_0052173, partial [Trifolium medium]|nr:hypothetical protein [Trifolium medium]
KVDESISIEVLGNNAIMHYGSTSIGSNRRMHRFQQRSLEIRVESTTYYYNLLGKI